MQHTVLAYDLVPIDQFITGLSYDTLVFMTVFYTRHYLLLCFQELVFISWRWRPVKGHCGLEFSSVSPAHRVVVIVITGNQC